MTYNTNNYSHYVCIALYICIVVGDGGILIRNLRIGAARSIATTPHCYYRILMYYYMYHHYRNITNEVGNMKYWKNIDFVSCKVDRNIPMQRIDEQIV